MPGINIGINFVRLLVALVEHGEAILTAPELKPHFQAIRDAAEALKGDIGGGD